MKEELINIYAPSKIIVSAISEKQDYLKKYSFSFFDIAKFQFTEESNKLLNIFFIPNSFTRSECKKISKLFQKINYSYIILCMEKNMSTYFNRLDKNIIFLPVSFLELDKKIHFLQISTIVKYKNLSLNKKNNLLYISKTKNDVTLTLTESNILNILMDSSAPVSRQFLNQHALGHTSEINSHSIDSHIYRLRKKLSYITKNIKIIVKNSGYYEIV